MPATAGRVRMSANNRVHSSAALQTHSIWQTVIRYDPHAPIQDDSKGASQIKTEDEPDNPYANFNFQDLLELARIKGWNTDEARGACKKCGRVGHLIFQCRNFVSVKDDKNEKDLDAFQATVMAELGKVKGSLGKRNNKSGTVTEIAAESSEDESESSDSSEDSEMERIIAQRFGKNKGSSNSKSKSLNKNKDLSDDQDSEHEKRKTRGRSKQRSGRKRYESVSGDDDDDARRKRKEKRRKRDELSDEEEHRRYRRKSRKEKSRRRSHKHSDDSEESSRQDKRKSRRGRSPSDSEVTYSDDSRVGRHSKRSDKKSRKRTREDDE